MQVGFASADITPATGMERPGGFSKAFHDRIHDPCLATAVVIEGTDQTVAMVGLDALSVKKSIVTQARQLIEQQTGIPGSAVMVGASHTHAGGPLVGSLPGDFARCTAGELCEDLAQNQATAAHPVYCDWVARQIATAVTMAWRNLQPALLSVGRGHEDRVAFNRRFWMKDGTQTTHPGKGNPDIDRPAGPADPEVGVLGAWTPEGKFIGCVVNFACHGTTGNPGTSADWIYWLRRTITGGMHGGEVVFLNGACGDVTQVNNLSLQEGEFGAKWSRRVGQNVGAEVLKVLSWAEPTELLPVAATRTTIPLATRQVSDERLREAHELLASEAPEGWDRWYARDTILLHASNQIEPEVSCEIQALQVGPAVYLSNPGEYFCQFGINIKNRSPFPYTWVVELANGCIGYVPTPEAMGPRGGGYEPRLAMSSKLVPEAGQMIEDASVALAASLQPGSEPPRPQVQVAPQVWEAGSSKASQV